METTFNHHGLSPDMATIMCSPLGIIWSSFFQAFCAFPFPHFIYTSLFPGNGITYPPHPHRLNVLWLAFWILCVHTQAFYKRSLLQLHRDYWIVFFGRTAVWTQVAGSLPLEPHLQSTSLVLEMESCEVFAWAGLELWSPWSQPPSFFFFNV
jgi:hypothetical protein